MDILKKFCIFLIMGHDLLEIIYMRILKDDSLSRLDIFQVPVPAIKLDYVAEEDDTPVVVVRADALYLIG
jgi:hypothetical protein